MRKKQTNEYLEKALLKSGYERIIGVDEVGRGCWAGPVVVSAFVFHSKSQTIPHVRDSKALTRKQRKELSSILIENEHALGEAEVGEVDELNILEATRLAIKRAIMQLDLRRSIVLIDGYFRDPFEFEYRCIKKGDTKHYSIAAASIIAKVYRDDIMQRYSEKYPDYGFESHVGYGTKQHRSALERYGICEIHRKSYKPVAKYLET